MSYIKRAGFAMVAGLGSITSSTSGSSSSFVELAGAAAVNAAIAGRVFGGKAAIFAASATFVVSALFGRKGAVITSAATIGLGLASIVKKLKSTALHQTQANQRENMQQSNSSLSTSLESTPSSPILPQMNKDGVLPGSPSQGNFLDLRLKNLQDNQSAAIKNNSEITELDHNDLYQELMRKNFFAAFVKIYKIIKTVEYEKDKERINEQIFQNVKTIILSQRPPIYLLEVDYLIKSLQGIVMREAIIECLIEKYEKDRDPICFQNILVWLGSDRTETNHRMISLRTNFTLLHYEDLKSERLLLSRFMKVVETGPVFLLNDPDKVSKPIPNYEQYRKVFIDKLPDLNSFVLNKVFEATPNSFSLAPDVKSILNTPPPKGRGF